MFASSVVYQIMFSQVFRDGLSKLFSVSIGANKAEFNITAKAQDKLINLRFSSVNTLGQGVFGGKIGTS